MVRIKQRYLLCEMMFPDGKTLSLNGMKLYELIQEKIRQLYGDYGSIVATQSLSPLSVKYLNKDTNIVLIRTKRETAKMVLSTLTLITQVKKVPIVFKTIHVGGTIRSSKKFLIQHHKNQLTEMLGKCTNDEERNEVKAAIIDSCQKCKKSMDLFDRVLRDRVLAPADD